MPPISEAKRIAECHPYRSERHYIAHGVGRGRTETESGSESTLVYAGP
jgi:hypothetical protein